MTDAHNSRLRWSYFSTISTTLMQLVASATITRFLLPSDYGLAAVASLCYTMTGYFTQLGMGRAVVQKPGLTKGNVRAAFWMGLLTGLAGFLILLILSPFLSRYFHEPRLPRVLIAFGLNLVFQSISMVSGGLLRREFRIRDLAICDCLGYLLSTFGVGLPLAIKGFGVWALVGSNVSQPFLVAIFYFLARPHSLLPSFRRIDYEHITSFGGKASLTTSIEALGGSLDMIIMGRLLPPAAIGLYNRSLTLSTQPGYNISTGLTRVFHPTISRAAEIGTEKAYRILADSQRQLMSVILPFCIGAAVAAPTIIPVIFGRQWASAVLVYQVLCVVAALDASFHLPAMQLEVANRFRNKLVLQTTFALLFGAGAFFYAPRGGIVAVACVYAGLQAVRTAGLNYLSARSLCVSTGKLLATWMPGLLCAICVGAVIRLVQNGVPGFASLYGAFRLTILMALAGFTAILIYRWFFKNSVYAGWIGLFKRSQTVSDGDALLASEEAALLKSAVVKDDVLVPRTYVEEGSSLEKNR